MGVLIIPQIGVAIERLGVFIMPGRDLVLIDADMAALDPGLELMEGFGIVVLGHAGVVAIIPVVYAADQIIAVDMAVRHQGAAVQATAIKHGHFIIIAHDHQVDIGDARVGRVAVVKLGPLDQLACLHAPPAQFPAAAPSASVKPKNMAGLKP